MDDVFRQLLFIRNFIIETFSPYFPLIRTIFLIISVIIFLAIVYLFRKLKIFESKLDQLTVFLGKDLAQKKLIKKFLEIEKKTIFLKKKDYGIILSEFDCLLNEFLKHKNIKGKNFEERLAGLKEKISFFEDLCSAHQISQRMASEPDFNLSLAEVNILIEIYKKTFRDLGLF